MAIYHRNSAGQLIEQKQNSSGLCSEPQSDPKRSEAIREAGSDVSSRWAPDELAKYVIDGQGALEPRQGSSNR
jgi:hypothetical protein